MAGYTRQSAASIVTGEIVEAAPLNAEFNQLQSAFDETTGHSHDGTSGEGPTIALISDADGDTKVHTETSVDEDIIRITIAGTELLQIGANSLRKATGSTVGLGSTTNRFDASFFASLTTSAATVDVLLVTTGGTANFSGNVLNNVGTSATATDAANVGYVDAKITSANLAGVTTNALVVGSAGTATFNGASTFNGVASFAGNAVTNVGTSATATDAANVGYVNAKITSANLTGVTTNALVVGSGGTTDFNSVRLSEVGTPTVATDAATKGYTDDAIAGQLGGLAGPVSTTDNGLVLWDGTAGGAVQNSPWTLDPTTGVMTPGGTDPAITDLVVSDTAKFEGLTTVSAAGEHAEEIDANATGTVTIQATDPTVLRRTLTGDVTLLVAGAPTPGKGWSTELRTTQDGTGGRDLTILPANLLTYSEQFDNAAWTKGNTTISANAATAPDGRTTMDKLVEDSATSLHRTYVAVTATSNHTFSIYCKAAERSIISLELYNGTTALYVVANLSTGTLDGSSSGSATIRDLGDGIYRISVTHSLSGAGDSVAIYLHNAGGLPTVYAGDGASGLYIWGAQLVAASTPLGYGKVGATRAASVVWRGGAAAEIDYAAQAAAVESRIIIGVGSDGEILIDDVSLEA